MTATDAPPGPPPPSPDGSNPSTPSSGTPNRPAPYLTPDELSASVHRPLRASTVFRAVLAICVTALVVFATAEVAHRVHLPDTAPAAVRAAPVTAPPGASAPPTNRVIPYSEWKLVRPRKKKKPPPSPGSDAGELGYGTEGNPGEPGQPEDTSDEGLASWMADVGKVGIPDVALRAYGRAELLTNQMAPTCNLSWTLLAGIGSVESNHGQSGRRQLLDNGTSDPPIVGIALDGTTTDLIWDTDDGQLDGDVVYDRAVGPMQFIPSTWIHYVVDADGDGLANPFDIDDAALAAGYKLCANDRDLSTEEGWWSAVRAYNGATSYAPKVYARAEQYGQWAAQ